MSTVDRQTISLGTAVQIYNHKFNSKQGIKNIAAASFSEGQDSPKHATVTQSIDVTSKRALQKPLGTVTPSMQLIKKSMDDSSIGKKHGGL